VLGDVAADFHWVVHAYGLMGNHDHLLVETPDANLSRGMRQLNAVFAQYSNRRHRRSGHVFQRGQKARLVDRDADLTELSRYIVLNPLDGSFSACRSSVITHDHRIRLWPQRTVAKLRKM
jgi:REP element-mobilizing transposase RayT